jgi:hypothetical protein
MMTAWRHPSWFEEMKRRRVFRALMDRQDSLSPNCGAGSGPANRPTAAVLSSLCPKSDQLCARPPNVNAVAPAKPIPFLAAAIGGAIKG